MTEQSTQGLHGLTRAAAEVMSTELAELACTGSDAPAEHALGLLRDALAGLVGATTKEELQGMATAVELLPATADDKAASLKAIHALIAIEGAKPKFSAEDDAGRLRSIARGLSYDVPAAGAIKHVLFEVAMRLSTGGYMPTFADARPCTATAQG